MNEAKAREILGSIIDTDDGLYDGVNYLTWGVNDRTACLDGSFTADKLEAIAWWMRNKEPPND